MANDIFTKVQAGINIKTLSTSPAPAKQGDINVNLATGNLQYHNGTSTQPVLTDTNTASLQNKTLDASLNTLSNVVDANISGSAAIAYSKLALTGGIVNADVANTAAIVYSKLSLSNSIVNADISSTAAIDYSKLNLVNSVKNADIASGAGIVYGKLNLSGSLVDADVALAAAIAYSKLNLTNSIVAADISSSAAIPYAKLNLGGMILDSDVAPAAGIAYSKLALTNSVVNSDISTTAAITYNKLSLTGGIVNTDVSASAAIAYSKLALTGSVVNGDISASAAIAYSKLSLAGSIVNADISGTAAIAYSKLALSGAILNTDLAGSIARSKIASGSINQVVINDGTGNLTSEATLAKSRGGTGQDNSSLAFPTSGTLATLSGTETLTNKTFGDSVTLTQISTPGSPSAGLNKLYAKTDGKLYTLTNSGTEVQVGSGAGSGGGSKNYLSQYVTSSGGGTSNPGNGDFELGNTSGWSLINTTLSSAFPTTVGGPGVELSRAKYIFTISAGTATSGATYTNNGQTFTVYGTIASGTVLVTTGTGNPTSSGTLTKSVGTGDATITFSAFHYTNANGNLSLGTVTSGSQLAATYSGSLISSAASTAGDALLSDVFFIDKEDQGTMLQISFAYSAISGTFNFSGTSSNTFAVYIYDVLSGAWIQPAGVYNLVQNSGVGKCTATFQTTSSGTKYQLAVININATSGAYTLYVDDFIVGPQQVQKGPAMSDWQSYTPTFVGFGTVSNAVAYARRVGDSYEVIGSCTVGTVSGSTASISLPSGFSIDASKISIGNTVASPGVVVGSYGQNGASNRGLLVTATGSSTGVVYFGGVSDSTGNLTPVTGASFNSSLVLSFQFKVPVLGWSSNTVMSADTDTRVVAATMSLGSSQTVGTSADTKIGYDTSIVDTAGMISGGRITVPVTGTYNITMTSTVTNITSGVKWYNLIYKNGSRLVFGGQTSNDGTGDLSLSTPVTIKLIAGDYIEGYLSSADASYTVEGAAVSGTWLSVSRISGPAVVAATENVACIINGTPASNAGGVPIVFPTVVKDTHNAYSTSTGQFTAPVSGFYQVSPYISCNPPTNQILQCYVAGSAQTPNLSFVSSSIGVGNGSVLVYANAGQTIDVRLSGSTGTFGSGNGLTIFRLKN